MAQLLIYIPDGDAETIRRFKEIAKREASSQGHIVRRLISDYVKTHWEGNPTYTLEKWRDPGFQPLPTLGEANRRIRLMGYADDVVKEIRDAGEAWYRLAERELARRGV